MSPLFDMPDLGISSKEKKMNFSEIFAQKDVIIKCYMIKRSYVYLLYEQQLSVIISCLLMIFIYLLIILFNLHFFLNKKFLYFLWNINEMDHVACNEQ